ncbi:hypothetical protein [Citrobacter amalonaticus]|uniref:hypothetical protein n=1 Tax=Citrobacter amalonaticus TaxID=35703 RepID=UPI00215C993E|nr:hypothetical protein [Citrobacter amalonaticus]MCR9031271.1 hypothetical protein [Citrobacter amalonaticus]MDL4616963.1 hypothetical protein [Citrobacter amalonaticus]MDL4621061.1 hypothetical protein [Citrobacter amalonaticus]
MMMNNMITDEQLAEITSGVVDGMPPTTQEVAMALELQERRAADRNFFMYGIAEPDGRAYMEEVCVSNDIGILQLIVDELNLNEGTDGYRVVALHTALPLTHPEREELEEYHKASQAARDIWAERQRQQAVKGFSTQQDDTYIGGELAAAAISYIEPMEAADYWPADWHDNSFRPSDYRRNMVKAAALLIAEIERLDRQQSQEGPRNE